MPTLEETEQQRKGFEEALEKLAEIKPENLVRSELGVEWNFKEGLPYFERILRLFDDVRECSFDGASHPALSAMTSAATGALGLFEQIQNFSTREQPQEAHKLRERFLQQARDNYDTYYEQITPRIAYAVRKGTDFKQLEVDARARFAEIRSTQEELQGTADAVRTEAKEILGAARRAAAEAGISQHEIFFEEAATEHDTSSKTWLIATIWIAVATVVVSIAIVVLYLTVTIELKPSQAVQVALGKVALLSVLYFGLYLSSRTYRAHRHNYTVNRHRQNALRTFQAFIKGAVDPTTKDAVLLYAAQAIFAPQATGFFGKEHETQSPAQILEIFRSSMRAGESPQ